MANKFLKILFTSLILSFVCDFSGQNLDSLSIVDAKYDSILRSDEEAINILFYKHDADFLINDLGPYGSPSYYPNTYHLYKTSLVEKLDPFNEKLYKLSGFKPYTNITYINASRKEQLFSIKHIQEFGKLLFLDFDLKKINSSGLYPNQEVNNTIFTGSLKYHSIKDNYRIKFSNGIRRNFYEENGGLSNKEDYENSLFNDELNYSVNLQNSNSFLKKYEYSLEQRLDLFRLNSDSIKEAKIYLKHKISYFTQQKVFHDNDPLSIIYNDLYIDSISTVDSIYSSNLSNTVYLGVRDNKFKFELFGIYDQNEYQQSYGISSVYHNNYAGFATSLKWRELNAEFLGKYGIDGYNKEDIESELILSYDKEKYNVKGGVTYFLNEPGLKNRYYNSNHFAWYNSSFKKQSILDFHINIKLTKSKLEFLAESKVLNNTLYYDSLAIANQDNKAITISSFSLAKNYKLLNFYFRTAFIYQLTSDEILFPLPEMVGRQVLYYQKYIFNKALKFQFGIGASYSTENYGYAYMPAINEFYVQKDTKLGYYPKIDVFINTHLKRAQIFLKYEHINAGASLHKSYAVPGYPPMSKSLKFGISWNMFD